MPRGQFTRNPNPLAITVEGPLGCWRANRKGNEHGYPRINRGGKTLRLIRVMYEEHIGPIPEGHELHHQVCETPWCVNPWHVVPLTKSDHGRTIRGIVAKMAQTECIHGHPLTPENTWVNKRGHRYCRKCHANRERKRLAKKRMALPDTGTGSAYGG